MLVQRFSSYLAFLASMLFFTCSGDENGAYSSSIQTRSSASSNDADGETQSDPAAESSDASAPPPPPPAPVETGDNYNSSQDATPFATEKVIPPSNFNGVFLYCEELPKLAQDNKNTQIGCALKWEGTNQNIPLGTAFSRAFASKS